MAYQVLARKYRPQRFSDVKGQEHVTRTLLNALGQNRIAHGYIFSGHRGIGKTTIARILAMALNCRNEIGSALRPSPEPCDVCESCTEVRAGNAVDVIEIDAATNRGIDEIRELRDAARYRPARDKYKVYILDEAHQITDAAFNALLKTLEEPPDHVIFMMATTQPEDIPQTIRSRCQHFSFHAVRFDDILEQLREIAAKEDVLAEDAALALLAEAGDGSMRDALSIMDQAIASAPIEAGKPHLDAAQIFELMGTVPNAVFERLMEAVGANQSATVVEEINRLLNAGNSASQLARQLVRYLRNSLMARLGGEATELLQVSPDERARAARTAVLFSEEDLTRFLDIMLRTFDQLNYRQEQRFHLELGLLKLVHLQRLLPMEQFLSQLPLGTKLAAAPAGGPGRKPGGALPGGAPSGGALPSGGLNRQAAEPSSGAPRTSAPFVAAPASPAFSPFETDRNRKSSFDEKQSSDRPAMGQAAREVFPPAAPRESTPLREPAPPRELTPLEIAAERASAARATIDTTIRVPLAGAVRASAMADSGSVAVAEEPETETTAEFAEIEDRLSGTEEARDADLASLRDAICAALEGKGHNTAAALLSAGAWTETADSVRAVVNIKRTMLSLTMNAEAEKICKAAMLAAGSTKKLNVVSADGGAAAAGRSGLPRAARPPASGSVQAAALAHPLVQQAQQLFSAEVRQVLDLRDKT